MIILKTVFLILAIGAAETHKEREKFFSELVKLEVNYETVVFLAHEVREDPELSIRLKEFAKLRWDIETFDKYYEHESYYAAESVLQELRDKDFEQDYERRLKEWSVRQESLEEDTVKNASVP